MVLVAGNYVRHKQTNNLYYIKESLGCLLILLNLKTKTSIIKNKDTVNRNFIKIDLDNKIVKILYGV